MMNNLFSSFDPNSMFNFQLNWSSSLMFIIMFPNLYWIMPSRIQMCWMIMFKLINNELKTITKNKTFQNNIIITSMFMFTLMNNFMGLFPYIFTSTSHLILTFTMSIPIWICFMMYGWINNTNHMFSHLVPNGTPNILMPFMVCIETISNIIRPITLSVRLSANMIAGHLILTLLGNSGMMMPIQFLMFMIIIQTMLLILEVSVSLIQSYVITILMSLYSSEVN